MKHDFDRTFFEFGSLKSSEIKSILRQIIIIFYTPKEKIKPKKIVKVIQKHLTVFEDRADA